MIISMHNILSIAKYERKTLLRSWFFRIFSILSILVLLGINFAMVIQGSGGDSWAIRSIPSAIPYFNLLILNVAQAIIAVFLASDFLKRDKKLDTTEVIYMRSMTNSEYVIGKTWGNLQVFLVLNVIVVALALVFNLLAENTKVDWISYGFYLVSISVPTLVFIMGLSFLLMSVVKNQAITFVLILGYIGITLFLLQAKYYYIFDYMAFNIPMLSSDIIGFGNMSTILTHRGIYFFLGSGFIFLTIFLLKRLPQSEAMTYVSLILSIVFIGAGSYLAYNHINKFEKAANLRAKVIELNNTYVKEKIPSIISNSINLEHIEKTINVNSVLNIKNENETSLNKLIFNLNNGLEVAELKVNGSEKSFDREEHLIIIQGVNLNPNEEATVEFSYTGKINEELCYLDIEEETIQEKYGSFVVNVDKRYAFLTPDYVLLTPETNWYPRAGVTYSSNDVSWNHTQFVDFDLKVKTTPELKAVSQGEINEIAKGEYTFDNKQPLTQLSLAIGKYQHLKVDTEKTEYGVWVLEGHDYFSEIFTDVKDTLPSIINEYLGDFERTYNLEYAFDRFALIEVPAQLKTFERTWTSCQEYVQPEQILIPEKGFMLRQADFEGSKKMSQRFGGGGFGGRGGGGEMSPRDLQLMIFSQFVRTFTSEQDNDMRGMAMGGGSITVTETASPYFIFPMLYNFQNNIKSDRWPITNRIFEAYLKSQSTDMRSTFMRDMAGLSEDEMANIALQDSTFENILASTSQKNIIDNVIKLKGDVLFSMIQYEAGQEEFEEFLQKVLTEYRFKNITFEEFDQRIKETFNTELTPIMDDWFNAKTLPGFLISPLSAVLVKSGDMMKTMVKLKATNFSDDEGLIKLSFRLGGGGGGPGRGGFGGGGGSEDMIDKLIYLEPHQTKDLSYLLEGEPRMVTINTMTSQNIPQVLTENFREIEEDTRATPYEGESISENPVLTIQPGEIIVDNEDPGFKITNNNKESLLEKWIIKEDEGELKYQGINSWRPPTSWTAITNTEFYGNYVLSGYYIKSGDGSQVAEWNAPIDNSGFYEVYYHLYKARNMMRGRGGPGGGRGGRGQESGEYEFIIHTSDGPIEQSLDINEAEEGWNSLGSYNLSSGTALIELSNKSEMSVVFADAVKIVKQ